MSVSGKKGRVGIPILLLHDCQGMIVTVETRNHELYRGLLDDTEDNWNMTLRNATWTKRDGSKTRLGAVFIRGSSINFMIAPKMLEMAPYFARVRVAKTGRARVNISSRSQIHSSKGGQVLEKISALRR